MISRLSQALYACQARQDILARKQGFRAQLVDGAGDGGDEGYLQGQSKSEICVIRSLPPASPVPSQQNANAPWLPWKRDLFMPTMPERLKIADFQELRKETDDFSEEH